MNPRKWRQLRSWQPPEKRALIGVRAGRRCAGPAGISRMRRWLCRQPPERRTLMWVRVGPHSAGPPRSS
eukprot:8352107-Pyramimonas_sp.AAC.1